MNKKPTPETDKFFATFADGEAEPSHAEYYARLQDLECERDILKKHISIMGISRKTANDEYFKLSVENEKLERERDDARESHRLSSVCRSMKIERDDAREQRDRLAEALIKCREDSVCEQVRMEKCCYTKAADESQANIDRADKALQYLNQPTKP